MIVIGIILVIVAAAALLTALFAGGTGTVTWDLRLFHIDVTALGAFLVGAATVVVFVVGLELLRSGARRGWQRRKEHRELRRRSKRLEKVEADQRTTDASTTTDETSR